MLITSFISSPNGMSVAVKTQSSVFEVEQGHFLQDANETTGSSSPTHQSGSEGRKASGRLKAKDGYPASGELIFEQYIS